MAKGLTMTRWLPLVFGIFLLIIPPAECAATPTFGGHSGEKLTIAGTGSGIATMQQIADSFQKRHNGTSFHFIPGIGSTGVIKAIISGRADIGLSSQSLTAPERAQGLDEAPYGRTPFVFAVQASNPIAGLKLSEIGDLFERRRTVWPDGRRVRLILRPIHADASLFLAGISPRLKTAYEKALAIPGIQISMTDRETGEHIEKTPGAFGTTDTADLAAEKRKIKALAIDGVLPAPANLADGVTLSAGRYPYALTMSLVYRRDNRTERLSTFIGFLFSDQGRKILSESGHLAMLRTAEK